MQFRINSIPMKTKIYKYCIMCMVQRRSRIGQKSIINPTHFSTTLLERQRFSCGRTINEHRIQTRLHSPISSTLAQRLSRWASINPELGRTYQGVLYTHRGVDLLTPAAVCRRNSCLKISRRNNDVGAVTRKVRAVLRPAKSKGSNCLLEK